MEISAIQKLSPFIILLISFFFSGTFLKIYYIGLPAMLVCFHLYYPESLVLQIVLLIIWGMFLVASWHIAAASSGEISKTKPMTILQAAISIVASACFVIYLMPEDIGPIKNLLPMVPVFIIGALFSYFTVLTPVITYVIAPLFIKNKTKVNTALLDYYKAPVGAGRSKIWHCYIRFNNDPDFYEVNPFQFIKFRKKIGVPFSYTKCECLFGFHYISKIRQLDEVEGSRSTWDTSPQTKVQRKIEKVIVIIFIVVVILFLIVFGAACWLW